MKPNYHFLRAGFALLLFSIVATGAFAQTGRVNLYTVTTSNLNFTSIVGLPGTVEFGSSPTAYYRGIDYTFSLPFAFNYDQTAVASGTTIYVNSNRIRFGSNSSQNYSENYGGLESSTESGTLFPFGAYYMSMGAGVYNGSSPAVSYYGCYYQVTGTSPNQVLTIQINGIHCPDLGITYENYQAVDEQVKLFQGTNVIEFIYSTHGGEVDPYPTSFTSGIGLNGFTSPSFQYLAYSTDPEYTPAADLIFTPPAPPQELSLTPNPKLINFGTTTPSAPITKFVTVSSVGAAGTSITIQGYSLISGGVPPSYTIVSGPPVGTVVPAGTSVQYGIQFQPFNNGTITGTFTVTTNGRDSGTQVMNLTGNGAVPLVSYSTNKMFLGTVVEVDSTSGVQWLYVNSIGGGPLVINSVQTIGQDARAYIVTHLPAGAIPAGGVDSIGIKFAPDLEGQPQAQLVINTTAVNIPSDTVNFLGIGILPHLATVSVNAANQESNIGHTLVVNFDSVQLGVDSCLQVTLTNPGSDTTAIMQNFFSSHDFDFTLTPVTGSDTLIPPGGSTNFQVCFSPLQRGFRSATVEIKTNIPHTQTTPPGDTSVFYVKFIGTGVPQYSSTLLVTGPSTNGTVEVGNSKCVIDTLWNTGNTTITVDSMIVPGANLGGFSWSIVISALTLFPNSHTTFELCASPADTGAQTSDLIVYGTSGVILDTGSLVLNVYGTPGKDSVFLGAPIQACIPDSDVVPIQVLNQGYLAELYSANITGPNAADFTIQPGAQVPELPGQHATFNVSFHPSIPGTETATITVYGSESEGESLVLTASSGAANIAGSQTATAAVGTTDTFSVTVNNTGTCEWTPGTVNVSAPFAYLSGGSTSIPAGQSGTLMFTFSPTALGPVGPETVTFTNSTGVSIPAANVVLNGLGTTSASVAMVSSESGYALGANYPNPTGGTTDVEITLPESGIVNFTLVDVKGETVQEVLNQRFSAGTFNVPLDVTHLISGVYYYRMSVNGVTLTRQMTVVK